MANIQVTCPTCNTTLEVGEEHDGKEVECGSCFQVFTARGPESKKPYKARREPEGKPAKFRRRRDEDDEDDLYDDDPELTAPPPRVRGEPGAIGSLTYGSLALITGLLALATSCCAPVGIGLGVVAMVCGGKGAKNPAGRAVAITGSVLGSLAVIASIGITIYLINAGVFNRGR
jgi:hypothetical protein